MFPPIQDIGLGSKTRRAAESLTGSRIGAQGDKGGYGIASHKVGNKLSSSIRNLLVRSYTHLRRCLRPLEAHLKGTKSLDGRC